MCIRFISRNLSNNEQNYEPLSLNLFPHSLLLTNKWAKSAFSALPEPKARPHLNSGFAKCNVLRQKRTTPQQEPSVLIRPSSPFLPCVLFDRQIKLSGTSGVLLAIIPLLPEPVNVAIRHRKHVAKASMGSRKTNKRMNKFFSAKILRAVTTD